MGNVWPFSYIFPILKFEEQKKTSQLTVMGVENDVMSPSPRSQIGLRVGQRLREFVQNSQKSQAETLAVLDDKLEDVHLSAFQPCGKAWQAAITCTFGLEKKDMEVKCIYLGGGFKLFFHKFHPDPWGNDPIWLLFSYGLKPPTRVLWNVGSR